MILFSDSGHLYFCIGRAGADFCLLFLCATALRAELLCDSLIEPSIPCTRDSGLVRVARSCSGSALPLDPITRGETICTLKATNSMHASERTEDPTSVFESTAAEATESTSPDAGRPTQSMMHPGLTLRMSLLADCWPNEPEIVSPMIICSLQVEY